MEKRILIGCPSYERYKYCIEEFLQAIKNIDYKNFDLLIVDNSKTDEYSNFLKSKGINVEKIEWTEDPKQRIVDSRNLILKRAIEGNYDYFLSLEQDVLIEPDTIKRLIEADKEIISSYYCTPTPLTLQDKESGKLTQVILDVPIIWMSAGDKLRRANPQEIYKKGLQEVGAIGLGCCLIKKEVLSKIQFRYKKEKIAFDDMFFCIDVKAQGYKIYVNGDIKLRHLHIDWKHPNFKV